MRACVLCDVGRFELREVQNPSMSDDEVLVRVSAVGLCGTDFHIFAGHSNYHLDAAGMPVPLTVHPQILGHEIAGVVEAIGGRVRDLAPGDRVVVDQGRNCVSANREPRCEYCVTGDSHQCEFYTEHGITGLPGGLADYVAVPAVNAVRIESSLDTAVSAMVEPLACVLHSSATVARAHARYAIKAAEKDRRVRSIFIAGAGPGGLMFTQYLRRVIGFDGLILVSEPSARKRELAQRFGAEVVDPAVRDPVEAVRERTRGRRVEYMIEAAGAGSLFPQIPGLIRKQATVLLYGHGHAGVGLEVMNAIQWLEPTLIASCGASGGFDADRRPAIYRQALRLIESQTIEVASLVTHRYTNLLEVPRAFSGEHSGPDYVKGVVLP